MLGVPRGAPTVNEPSPRRTVSQADHHRRRRRAALAAVGAVLLLFIVVVAGSAGSSGTWNPTALRDGAITELPRLRLEEQAQRASVALARQKKARTLENGAIARTLAQGPMIRTAGDQTRSVALTFDDGPSPYTQRILDTLQRYGAKATFFTLGNQLSTHPFPLQRAVAEGHAIANHTWSHADLTKLSRRDVRSQISDQNVGLQRAGIPRPKLFRPPYGAYNEETLRVARDLGMLSVLWTIDSNDYKATDPKAMADAVLAEARPGAIILMHDGGGDRTVTSKALPLIVRGLRDRKFKMVTVPKLLIDNPAPVQQDTVTRTPVA